MNLDKLDPNELIYKVQEFQREHVENLICADCKSHDPRWASYNLGCFLCLRCSGIHRSLGTHISKVKSIDLDNWTVDQVESMLSRGNKICNDYWEAKLPKDTLPPQSNLEAWIQSKYVLKKYLKDSDNDGNYNNSGEVQEENEEGNSRKNDYYSDLNNINFDSNNKSNSISKNNSEKSKKLKNNNGKSNVNLLKGAQYFNICDSDDESDD